MIGDYGLHQGRKADHMDQQGEVRIERKIKQGWTIDLHDKVTLENPTGGQLNPNWVEWLMGWPIGWTDLKPLETDRFQSWLQQHGIS